MAEQKVTESNSWLVFADDLNWSKKGSEKEERLLRSMLCQQFLFVETSIIPDSWWLSNLQLRRVLENSDLQSAVRENFLIPARGDKFISDGLFGRFKQQLSLPPGKRMANFIPDTLHGHFLSGVDKQGGFVAYDALLLGNFFSNIVKFVSKTPQSLEPFGLAHVHPAIEFLVSEKSKVGENLTASDLYNLFGYDKSLQDRAMAMFRPIYAINAPANYGYHITLAGDEGDRLHNAMLSLFSGLYRASSPQDLLSKKAMDNISVPLKIDDPVFKEAGMLTFDEIAGARAVHFDSFKKSFVGYCRGNIGNAVLENAYKSYQSNLRDYLTKRNAKFDLFVAKSVNEIAVLSGYASKVSGCIAAHYAEQNGFVNWEPVVIGSSVAIIAHFVQRVLDQISTKKDSQAMEKGKIKLLTRLDVWMGNKRAIKDGRIQ